MKWFDSHREPSQKRGPRWCALRYTLFMIFYSYKNADTETYQKHQMAKGKVKQIRVKTYPSL